MLPRIPVNSRTSRIGKPQRSLCELPGEPMRQEADGNAPTIERRQGNRLRTIRLMLIVDPGLQPFPTWAR